jgi:hypothetical protein
MAVIDFVFRFEVSFELVDRHIFWCVLHDFEDLSHVVEMFLLFDHLGVTVGIVEED